MELELKHLKGYLDYGLQCLNQHLPDVDLVIEELKGIDNVITWCGRFDAKHGSNYIPICGIKPLLHPLSSLTKEIEHGGKRFVPIVELLKIKHKAYFENNLGGRYLNISFEDNPNYSKAYFEFSAIHSFAVFKHDLDEEPYWVIKKLFQWHFNVHNLPDHLFIDKSTVKI